MSVSRIHFDGAYVKANGDDIVFGFCDKASEKRCEYILWREHKLGKREFEITEKPCFDSCGPMLDVSRGMVLTVEGAKRALDIIHKAGLNMAMLYTEDMFELKDYPMFGYMRGIYTISELSEIDEYAKSLGIELIPCIQTLGHLAKYTRWGETPCDVEGVLLPENEDTYKFIEAEIEFMSRAFSSRRIHLGMDEAARLGLGRYLREHGFCDQAEIFNRHLERVLTIA